MTPAATAAPAPSPAAPDVVRVVQLSDTHFRAAPGARSFTAHEPEDGLAAVLADAARAVEEAAAVVVTGDLADLGEPAAYERLGEVLDPLPAPVHCLHGDLSGTFEGRPVHVCPSSFMSIDPGLRRLDGPGHRTYLPHPDGRIETEVRTVPGPLTDATRATPLPAFLADLLSGRATPEELAALDDAQFEARYGERRPMPRADVGRADDGDR
ncbi:metallophosphoesterase [Kitasatospora purpeofusca]|uniref:metallophosphoesterase n=1 Tax=Kitasatospora purpeofusca TaxID=67352 RepID=UPI0033C65E5A